MDEKASTKVDWIKFGLSHKSGYKSKNDSFDEQSLPKTKAEHKLKELFEDEQEQVFKYNILFALILSRLVLI